MAVEITSFLWETVLVVIDFLDVSYLMIRCWFEGMGKDAAETIYHYCHIKYSNGRKLPQHFMVDIEIIRSVLKYQKEIRFVSPVAVALQF